MKKQKSKTPAYTFEFKLIKKNSKSDNKKYHLYINGVTDSVEYTNYSGHMDSRLEKGKSSEKIKNIPGKYFPNDFCLSLDCKFQLMNRYFETVTEVLFLKEDDTFQLLLLLPEPDGSLRSSEFLLGDNFSSMMQDEMRNLKKSRLRNCRDMGHEMNVCIKGKPGETINDLMKILLPSVELIYENSKTKFLKQLKQLEKEVNSISANWK